MRHGIGESREARSSALWGKRSGERPSVLWGKGGRGAVLAAIAALALVLPNTGAAKSGPSATCGKDLRAVVAADLVSAACANPAKTFAVIVQGSGVKSAKVRDDVKNRGGAVKRAFRSISGVSAKLPGAAILKLARSNAVLAITADAPVEATDYQDAEMWRQTTRVDALWDLVPPVDPLGLGTGDAETPAIAIVDSGVDTNQVASFGGRIAASVNLSSLSPGATGDDQGHGTMVAGIAAGADPLIPGVAQDADIVAIRTANAEGQSMTSDVIAAADWILANHKTYGIRVANFSLAGSTKVSFRFDPLDKAVERLWFAGIVVVASAGNHGEETGPVDMSYAPANDPFVITVGAVDQSMTADQLDDFAAPWSANGHTMDGFFKPEVSAPGRYLVMPVPDGAYIPSMAPERVLAPGYMWMSGTSFSAPIVSGVAAKLLALHPDWTPDQVKGALMVTAVYLGDFRAGVGEIDAQAASAIEDPPNPNAALYAYVETDPISGGVAFNEASWARAAETDASWARASWAHASWANASWASASWASASWASASWASSVESMMSSAASWNQSARPE